MTAPKAAQGLPQNSPDNGHIPLKQELTNRIEIACKSYQALYLNRCLDD